MTRGDTYNISTSAKVNISDFLLQLSEVQDAFFKANEKKGPFRLSYPMIRHLLFVDEVRISSDDSAFYPRERNSNPLLYQNQFAYLMTGEDDRNYVPKEEKKIAQSRVNGKIEYLEEEISTLKTDRDKLGEVNFVLMTDKQFIDSYKDKLSSLSGSLETLYKKQRELTTNISTIENDRDALMFYINRLRQLKKNYELELQRLEFINQGTEYLSSLSANTCPLCGTELDEHHLLNIDHFKYVDLLAKEYGDVLFKLRDVTNLISLKEKELEVKDDSISEYKSEEKIVRKEIEKITPNYDILTQMISKAEENLRKRIKHDQLEELIKRKEQEQKDLKYQLADISKRKTKKTEEKEYINESYLNLLKEVLIGFNFIQEQDKVLFGLEDFDITINGKVRATYGKGNRAITCTAALFALMDFLIQEERNFSRIIVLDSPVCTKYDGNSSNDRPEDHVLDAFAKYCNDKEWLYQCIILDNKIDSSDVVDKEKYPNIHFIEFGTEEREGLFLSRKRE